MTMATDDPLIEVSDLCKRYTIRRKTGRMRRKAVEVPAVEGVSFSIDHGELVGYLGPNGAGKSTTIKMLTGILAPSSGRVRVAGLDPSKDRIALARRIGVVFGQRTTLWWDLPLRDSFELLGRLYQVPATRHRRNLAVFVESLDLGPLLDTPVRQLSLGQRMRGDLTAALLHDPALVYLDEPTIGLDVVSKATMRSFLTDLNREQGTTILLTTHDLDDVEQLCSRVIVIDHGSVVFDGDIPTLRARTPVDRTLIVDLSAPGPPIELAGAVTTRVDGPRQWLSFPAGANAAELVAAIAARYPVADIAVRDPDIEDVVRELYRSTSAAAS